MILFIKATDHKGLRFHINANHIVSIEPTTDPDDKRVGLNSFIRLANTEQYFVVVEYPEELMKQIAKDKYNEN